MLSDIKMQPLFKTGWGRYYYGNPAVELVDTDPAHNTGPSWIYDLYGINTGSTIAGNDSKRAQLLAEAIPALSLPVGSRSTNAFGNNYDMPDMFADNWPSTRGTDPNSGLPNWHHSDMREVAYIYQHRFIKKLVEISK